MGRKKGISPAVARPIGHRKLGFRHQSVGPR
jgi:hypothetical protein